jgi:hypothetical protein
VQVGTASKHVAHVNTAVLTACLGKKSLVCENGSLLERSMLVSHGCDCIQLITSNESGKNLVKFEVRDWAGLLGSRVSSSSIAVMNRNACTISGNGFVLIRFHFNYAEWDQHLHDDILLASTVLVQCIWDNC